jgi:trehalose/maltose hydrolase-like predicted phosphorylase
VDRAILTASLHTARRYEAVIAVCDSACSRRATVDGLAALCASGAAIAIIGSQTASDVAERFIGFEPGAGVVLVAASADPWCVIIERSGTWIVQRGVAADGDRNPILPGIDDAVAQWVASELWKRGIGLNDVVVIYDGDATTGARGDGLVGLNTPHDGVANVLADLEDVVAEQRARRDRGQQPRVLPDSGWDLTTDRFDVERLRVDGSLFALADGMVGTSGAPLASYPGLHRWVIAGNVYVGDGPGTHLLTAPIAMQLPCEATTEPLLRRVLDLHTGLLYEEMTTTSGTLASVRFSLLGRPGTAVFRAHCPGSAPDGPALLPPADDTPLDSGVDSDVTWMRVVGNPGGVVAAAVDERRSVDGEEVIDRVAVYRRWTENMPSPDDAVARAREAADAGFDVLLAEQRAAWAVRWEQADVGIEGDDDLQREIRFALFHLMSSAPDDGEAAVGARGLVGSSYRGHVFWDADTFTLPFLAATHPASARAMLEYRLRRLPAARTIARELGREGARFPWESAHSGRDVTPTSARDRTGRVVPIRTGQLEEHIVAQVAWATCCYVDWTGDETFARGPGLALLVETARYWASRVRREADGTHIYGVIGPDEYHEPVDDNAFTNVMARWNLRRAADAVLAAHETGVTASEAARWQAIADELIDGFDHDTGIYEQCAGFHKLEPLIIAEVAPRRPISADLLLGARRVRGAQVIKQADVLMLHHLVPDAVEPGTLEPNLRFYEPRTAHGSSLSPGIHASLFARARDYDRALDALRIACRVDIDDLTDTTAGGLHLATMGSVWQALTFGFAGIRPRGGRLAIDPRLPPAWAAMEFRVRFHGTRVHVRVEKNRLTIDGDGPLALTVEGTEYRLDGRRLSLRRRGPVWEEVT